MLITDLLFLLSFAFSDDESVDHDLAMRIRAGDTDAFKEFYNRYSQRLISLLCSKGMDQPEAEDILQQAFLIIWEKRSDLSDNKSIRAFLFTIALNRLRNHFRDKKMGDSEYAYKLNSDTISPADHAEQSEAMSLLHSTLKNMPAKRREVFELCYLQEFTYREAGEMMQITRKTVENHMSIALKEIREAMKNHMP
jgi:RNA polymerase sigma-70 factor (ECF subfamily)